MGCSLYYLEFERKRLTDEELENLKQVYFSKSKNNFIEMEDK
ncbi:hypothetical protein [Spiroplasma endosymbiont of Megaselia nigra]|nr:hypothetical protein [Spiroplasma endosymbiont of Megaselia nigra]